MGIFKIFIQNLFGKSKQQQEYEAMEPQIEAMLLAMRGLTQQPSIKGLNYSDIEIPGGYGEFGREVTNPVPVQGIMASSIYLGRLRSYNSEKINWKRIGSFVSSNIQNPIDGYKIFDSASNEIATIYISPYHQYISSKAPKGFTLSN